jgi:integrase
MTSIRLAYINRIVRRGKVYHYFRRPGFKPIRLPDLPGSSAFMAVYEAALASGAPLEIGANRSKPGTINAASAAFYHSHVFTKNRPITQATDRNILEAFRARHGDKRIATLERRHIEAILAEKADKPAARRNLLRVLRVFLDFAVDQGLRRDNPARGIKLKAAPTAGFHSWSEEELRAFEARHPVGTKARLALAMLLYAAVRRADVVRLGPEHVRNGRLVMRHQKNGAEVDMPMPVPLAEVLAATPMLGLKTFLVTDYGRPFTASGFGNWFADRCRDAGVPGRAHGLRKAACRRMAEAGCSEDYIASVSGHKNMDEIRTYVRSANKRRMADAAMTAVLTMFPAKER